MKYIITEKQHNLIKESKSLKNSFQKLVDFYLESKKNECENDLIDDEYLCEFLDIIDKITVYDVKLTDNSGSDKNKGLIYLIFDYWSHQDPEFSDFYYQYLGKYIKQLMGVSFILRYKPNQLIKPY
jgi:hypothetical protein